MCWMICQGLTMLGAACVFLLPKGMSSDQQRKVLDASLGFAAGVMTAASYWSLLAPAIDHAEESGSHCLALHCGDSLIFKTCLSQTQAVGVR